MPITIGSNIASLGAQRKLAQSSDALAKTFERLSSGQRINQASDDAAGLSVATSLNLDARVFTKALSNANDGISLLSVAQGALTELSNITTRIQELAEQAANGVYTLTQRTTMNSEVNALVSEFNRITQTTQFNGIKSFDAQGDAVVIQTGYGVTQSTQVSTFSELARTVGTGTFQVATSYGTGGNPDHLALADVNSDGKIDYITADQTGATASVALGNGDGTFRARSAYGVGGTTYAVTTGDVNGDGALDIVTADWAPSRASVLLGNGDGTFKARVSYVTGSGPQHIVLHDINADGKLDMISADPQDDTISILVGNGDGSFKARSFLTAGDGVSSVAVGDINGDLIPDIIGADHDAASVSVFLGIGNGSFQSRRFFATNNGPSSAALADLNHDGKMDLVTSNNVALSFISVSFGNGDGSFAARSNYVTGSDPRQVSLADINGDGHIDMASADQIAGTVSVFLNNGDGSFATRTAYTAGAGTFSLGFADLNGDGAIDMATSNLGPDTVSSFLANSRSVTSLPYLNISTAEEARNVLTFISGFQERIGRQIGAIGAHQSRLASSIANLQTSVENYRAAESRISDTDVAQDSANLLRMRIGQQIASAVLAQANQQPELALRLIR